MPVIGYAIVKHGFKDENTVGIKMKSAAEFFFDEYNGYAAGYAK